MAKVTNPKCIPNPECAAAFAAIAEQYKFLKERMENHEQSLTRGMESIRTYLKEEYNKAVETRINTLETTVETLKKRLDKVNKKILLATGALAAILFFIDRTLPFIMKIIGG